LEKVVYAVKKEKGKPTGERKGLGGAAEKEVGGENCAG